MPDLPPPGFMQLCFGHQTAQAVHAGDFFTAIPACGDLVMLVRVLHDWGDREAKRILERCREAMTEGAILLVVDKVVALGERTLAASMNDLEMKLLCGGVERTEGAFRSLVATTGFEFRRVLSKSRLGLLEFVAV